MKPYKIILFITSIFTLLGVIGYLIPSTGFNIGKTNIEFPSPQKVMQGNIEYSDKELVDIDQIFFGKEALLKLLKKELEKEIESKYKKVRRDILVHNLSLSYPNDSIEWIFSVFDALENAKKQKVRIIHYGDSQIESDRMSNWLRASLQKKFGGYGVGLIPAIQTIPAASIGQKCSTKLARYTAYGSKNMHMETRNYGPLGQTAKLNSSTTTFTFYNPNYKGTLENTKYFDRITILLDEIESEINAILSIEDEETIEDAIVKNNSITFNLPDSTSKVSITIQGKALIHGFMLDGSNIGIQLDNAPMRGCSGTIFSSINTKSLEYYYKENNIALIILQFGGNSVPFTKSNKAINTYCKQLARQIDYFQNLSPLSKILFIGPSDMSTNIDGKMQTYPHLPKFINALKTMCLSKNVAYWDLYAAMGGKNSMVEWVNTRPQLAGSDYIHFTNIGADYASKMLWKDLMEGYKLYEMKNEK